jgi:hypothetical protein
MRWQATSMFDNIDSIEWQRTTNIPFLVNLLEKLTQSFPEIYQLTNEIMLKKLSNFIKIGGTPLER